MSEEKKLVRVKLVKHEWPDERAARHKRYLKRILFVLLGVALFCGGVFAGFSINKPTINNTVVSGKVDAVYRIMNELWYFGNDVENLSSELIDDAIYGMTTQEDIHTTYMDSEYAKQFLTSMEGQLVGIGVQYSTATEDYIILKVFEGSPAEKAGLKVGDIIRQVDGVSIEELEDIAMAVKGKAGTEVVMGVQRGGEILNLTCTRAAVNTSANGYVKGDVGVLEILTIAENTSDVVGEILSNFEKQQVKKLIIDLRGNTGGYLSTIVDVASYFLPSDSIVLMEENKEKDRIEYKTNPKIVPYSYEKIVILTDQDTASAAEVLTIGMSELMDNVTVVGDVTYGKGTIQTTLPFSDGSMVKYTKAIWLSPKGTWINDVGITPDVLVETAKALLTGAPKEFDPVGYDSVSDACYSLQIYLKYLGYDIDREDGYFSNKTLEALKQFQNDYGMVVQETLDSHLLTVVLSKVIYEGNVNEAKDIQMIQAFEEIMK